MQQDRESVQTVGVIGGGRMGTGIACVAVAAGIPVFLYDISPEQGAKAKRMLGKFLEHRFKKGLLTESEVEISKKRFSLGTSLEIFAEVDLVIESVPESESLKKKVFQDLSPFLKESALLATNTSSLSITRLAAATDRPECFIGMHFMNPVPVMALVELIRGVATCEETFNKARAFVRRLGKREAVSEDFPGFIVQRVLMPMLNEAIYTLYEGVGTVESIDIALRLGARHPMGPLQLADFIGLDTCLSVLRTLYDGLADSKYRPCPLLVKYVEAGWLGRKTKRGFYDYRGGTPSPLA